MSELEKNKKYEKLKISGFVLSWNEAGYFCVSHNYLTLHFYFMLYFI